MIKYFHIIKKKNPTPLIVNGSIKYLVKGYVRQLLKVVFNSEI
jgi:hypothetical protein